MSVGIPSCCNDCKTEKDVQVIEILRFEEEGHHFDKWTFCKTCLIKKNLWCRRHGCKLLIHDASIVDHPTELMVLSACQQCVLETVVSLSDETVEQLVEPFRETDMVAMAAKMGEYGHKHGLAQYTHERQAVLGLYLMAELHNRTPQQAITDLLTSHYQAAIS